MQITQYLATPSTAQQAEDKLVAADDAPGLLDFDSDEPLMACPLRNNGDAICESCQ